MDSNSYSVVVIGGSAGALHPVKSITRALPRNLPVSVFVVLHSSPRERSFLPDLLNCMGPLRAAQAREGEPLVPGCIYVPPPDRHLVIGKNHLHITRGPREGLHRPSINVTFRSAATSYGSRVIGVLLSGLLDDGASGLWDIASHGGVTIVQDPEDAAFPSMPQNALWDVPIDYRIPSEEIGALITSLVKGEQDVTRAPRSMREQNEMEKYSGFSCPECHGPLWENGNGPLEFRCKVGHQFSLKALIDEHTSTQERKLYEAMLALEEGAALSDLAARHVAEERQLGLQEEAAQLRHHASAIRKLLEDRISAPLD